MRRPDAPRAWLLLVLLATVGASCSGNDGPATRATPTSGVTAVPTTAHVSGASPAGVDRLPGLNTGPPPWPAEHAHLAERLRVIGLPPLGPEVTRVHFHVNLVVVVDGRRVPVPAGIGFQGSSLAEIHTHTGSGTIHVEASHPQDFTLGDVFDVWGVRFSRDCLGGECTAGDRRVRVFLDGQPNSGDPTQLALANQQVVVVTYGGPDQVPDPMPARFVYEGRPKPA